MVWPRASSCIHALLVGSVLVAAGCGGGKPRPNILLVTLDTTRADRLGAYGYAAARTPVLDALAASGVRFDRAYTQAPLTLTSHASLLTGLHPRATGLHVNAQASLPAEVGTLAEELKAKGYRTGAFVSAFVLDSTFGLDRGFEVYDDDLKRRTGGRQSDLDRPADEATDAALKWLGEGSTSGPFFAWVHYFDPHSPYTAPEPYRSQVPEPYDGEIAFVDAQLGRLLEALAASGQREDTLVVVVGDHGESLHEHGEPEHGLFVYDSTVHVPLIVSWSGHVSAGAVASADVQVVDVYPTIRELLGAKADPRLHGTSFAALLGEPAAASARPPVYGESLYGQVGYGWAPLRFLIRERWKYVEAPRPELYDRQADPTESHNLAAERPDQAEALRLELVELESRIPMREGQSVALDAEAQAKLRSLGYVGAAAATGAVPPSTEPRALRDPKDMLEIYLGHIRAWNLLYGGKFADAATLLEDLLRRSPESLGMYEDLGWAYLGTGRFPEAQTAYETSLRALPDDAERLWGLGEALRRQGKFREAIPRFERAAERWPTLGQAQMSLALSYHALGDEQKAYEHARRHVELDPRSKLALGNLANLSLAVRKYDEAVQAAGELIGLDIKAVDGHYVRWEALRAAGRRGEAIQALRDSREMLPGDWMLTCALGWMLAVTPPDEGGSGEEALRLARLCVNQNPRHPRSFDTLAAAQAATGAFQEAARAARQAIALTSGPQAAPIRAAIEARLHVYEAGQPFRE